MPAGSCVRFHCPAHWWLHPAAGSPDWPQPLVSIENPLFRLCGKNLLTNTLWAATNAGITYTPNSDGSITLKGFNKFIVLPATDNNQESTDNPEKERNIEIDSCIE